MKKKGMKKIICFAWAMLLTVLVCGCEKSYATRYNEEIDEIMADEVEIECKWLVDADTIPYDLSDAEIFEIEQTYINFSPEIRVRRINGEYYTFAVKTNLRDKGLVRDELETDITKEEYDELYAKREGNTIQKTRYQFLDEEGYLVAIDIFHGDLDGLAYMEIEFVSAEEAYEYIEPEWVIADVTDDVNYKNGYLARFGIPESFYEYMKK